MNGVNNRKLQLIILLVLVSLVGTMSIAYAVLSTTLNINGTAQVQDASWNVHFSNIQVNPYSVEINPVITDNNKITFSADLTTPGDFYKFTVDIVNEGSIDAMIESIAKVPELTTEQKKYLRYEVEYVDGTSINDSQLLKSGETKTISVLFSYRNDIPVSDLPNIETDFDLEIVLVYVQANATGTEISGKEKFVKVVSGDLNTVGSEIAIGDEHFYVISSDEDSVTMLAKMNIIPNNSPTQSSSATTDQFSPSGYWGNVSSGTYVYNSNARIYRYISRYRTNLESQGAAIEEIRLIKVEELESLGCSRTSSSCSGAPEWVGGSRYWTGSVYNSEMVWGVTNNKELFYDYCYNTHYGIRPVITLSI